MNAKTTIFTLALLALASRAEASKNYSGYVCRYPDMPGNASSQHEYLDDGSYYEPNTGFQLPIAICQIPTDTSTPITQITVHTNVTNADFFGEGVFCRAEMRAMSGGIWWQSAQIGTTGVGNQSFSISIPPTTTPYFLQLRCNIGSAKIRSISVN